MPSRILCNSVKREVVKASPGLASGLFYYVPLHKIRYGIHQAGMRGVICMTLAPSIRISEFALSHHGNNDI